MGDKVTMCFKAHLKQKDKKVREIAASTKTVEEDFKKFLWEVMSIIGSNRFEKMQAFQTKIKSLGEKYVLVLVLIELVRDRL